MTHIVFAPASTNIKIDGSMALFEKISTAFYGLMGVQKKNGIDTSSRHMNV